jgi:hypothetical protein
VKRPWEQAPRDNASPAAKRTDRARAEAAGLAMIEREAKLRREKSAKLKALREARDAAERK